MTSVDIGELSDFAQGVPRQLKVAGRTLVGVRVDGRVFVLDDRCSHEEFSLSEGEVDLETEEIECARHGAMFDLATGEPRSLPATRAVRTFAVEVLDGNVVVAI